MPKTHINTKNTKMNTKWLNNALRSIGVTSKASLKSMAPNISDAVSTGAKTSKNLITNIKSSKNGIDGVMNTLRTNRYVSIAEKAYNNALADLKSGNFNNLDIKSNKKYFCPYCQSYHNFLPYGFLLMCLQEPPASFKSTSSSAPAC